MRSFVEQYFESVKSALNKFNVKELETFIDILITARAKDKTIYIFGNGGSGLAASHFVSDIGKSASYGKDKRFKVVCLNDNTSMISAYANDVSYNDVFVEQLKNFLTEDDVVIGISSSGNSANVLNAIEFANRNGGITVGFTGMNGGKLKNLAQFSVNANIDDMQVSEDFHLIMIHLMMRIINDKDNL